jgi:hypothetical protein
VLLLVAAFIGACYGDAWLSQRKWEASLHRIQPDEVEVYDVMIEALDDTNVMFLGRVKNNSKKYFLADVEAKVFFQRCDKDRACTDVAGWGGKAFAVGWRLPPGKSGVLKLAPHLGDTHLPPSGHFSARVTGRDADSAGVTARVDRPMAGRCGKAANAWASWCRARALDCTADPPVGVAGRPADGVSIFDGQGGVGGCRQREDLVEGPRECVGVGEEERQ